MALIDHSGNSRPTHMILSQCSRQHEQQKPTCRTETTPESQLGINVFFRFVDGKTYCLWVDPSSEDIASLKKRLLIHCRSSSSALTCLDYTARDLFVVWNGKPLDDDAVLADYTGHWPVSQNQYSSSNMTLFVSVRNRGGCFMVSLTILMIIIMAIVGSTCTCGLSLAIVPFLMPLLFVLPLFCL